MALDRESERIAALNRPNLGRAHRIDNLQNGIVTIYRSQKISAAFI